MRAPVLLFVVLLTACASTGARTAPDRVLLESPEGMIRRSGNPVAQITVAVPVDTAFSLITAAYQKLGIEVKTFDPVTRRVGNSNFILRREFAGKPMSSFLNCGNDLTGPFADRARIFLSLVSTVEAKSGGAVINTVLEATAQDIATSSDRKYCGTTGLFESELRDAVETIAEVRASLRQSAPAPSTP